MRKLLLLLPLITIAVQAVPSDDFIPPGHRYEYNYGDGGSTTGTYNNDLTNYNILNTQNRSENYNGNLNSNTNTLDNRNTNSTSSNSVAHVGDVKSEANNNNDVQVNNTTTNKTYNAPSATAPTMYGSPGTESSSVGLSTPFGGVSFGKSRTTREYRLLLNSQRTTQDIENIARCSELNIPECNVIINSIMRRYK